MDNNLGLTKFHHLRSWWCQKVLPLVYDESLSYYEFLCKLLHHVNQLIDAINEIIDILEDHESRITALETWRTQMEAWKATVDSWINQINLWKASVNEHLTEIDNALDDIYDDIETIQDDLDTLESTKQDKLTAGENITIENNVISATGELTLLPATATRLGGVKIGEGIDVTDDGTISVEGGGYTLPTMSSSVKGGAKLGSGLTILNDTLSVDASNVDLSSNESITNIESDITDIENNIADIISGETPVPSSYVLPTMSASTKGGAKVGTGLKMTGELLGIETAIVTGTVNMVNGTGTATVSYPSGYNKSNCIPIAFGCYREGATNTDWNYGTGIRSTDYLRGSLPRTVRLGDSIEISVENPLSTEEGSHTYQYRLVLIKIS